MRLSLKFEALKTVLQEHFHKQYFTDMHGFLANIAGKDSKYGKFCFGNLFPIRNQKIEEKKIYSILISSSDPLVIEKIFFSLVVGSLVNLGEMQFRITEISIEQRKLNKNSVIESISPINITKNKDGKIYFYKLGDSEYLKLLQQHLLEKYAFLKGTKCNFNLFSSVVITANEKHPFAIFQINFFNKGKNDKFKVCGSKLVFTFKGISDEQLKVFQTLFDAGFGERTTYGAGFMIERGRG